MEFVQASGRAATAAEEEELLGAGFSYQTSYRMRVPRIGVNVLRELWTRSDGTIATLGPSGGKGRETDVITVFADGVIVRTIGVGPGDAGEVAGRVGVPELGLFDAFAEEQPAATLARHARRLETLSPAQPIWPLRDLDALTLTFKRSTQVLTALQAATMARAGRGLGVGFAAALVAAVVLGVWQGCLASMGGAAAVTAATGAYVGMVLNGRLRTRATGALVPPERWPRPLSPFITGLARQRPYLGDG